MKAIINRLRRLENANAPADRAWALLEAILDARRRRLGPDYVEPTPSPARMFDDLGPVGLWLETARTFLESGDESFAETMARSMGIGTDQLQILMAQGQIASASLGAR